MALVFTIVAACYPKIGASGGKIRNRDIVVLLLPASYFEIIFQYEL